MESCRHLSAVSSRLSDALFDPAKWACAQCGTTDSVWACLTCYRVSCGRYTKEHSLSHARRSKHPLAMEVNEGWVFCYSCDDYVMNDTAGGDLRHLRDVLTTISAQPLGGPRPTRTASAASAASGLSHIVLRHRRAALLGKCFAAWRDLVQTKRHPRRHLSVRRKERPASAEPQPSTAKARPPLSPPASPATSPAASPRKARKRLISEALDSEQPLPGVTGLRNLGNTCYMNSVLQVLSNLDEFRDRFLSLCPLQVGFVAPEEGSTEGRGGRLSEEIRALLKVMWSGKMSLVIPDGFLQALWRAVPSFRGYRQQDAQEFLCEVLDKLSDELLSTDEAEASSSAASSSSASPSKRSSARRGPRAAESTPSLAESAMRDLVGGLFNGELESRVRCGHCGRESVRHELFSDLSLEFPPAYQDSKLTNFNMAEQVCPLSDMLRQFTAPEELGAVYSCEQCLPSPPASQRRSSSAKTPKREAVKQMRVSQLPRLLRLHLKRFRWRGRNERDKLSLHVAFPERLDMGPFLAGGAMGGASRTTTYSLVGLIQHHGRGFNSGHYTSYCWNSRGPFWLHCNDARLQLCSLADVLQAQAYILFYRLDSAPAARGAGVGPRLKSPASAPLLASDLEQDGPTMTKRRSSARLQQ